jgi:hypothetical protein
MRVCPNCGNPLGGSPRYCAGCATQLGTDHAATPEPLAQVSVASPLPARAPAPAWSFLDPPAPWIPGDPGWAARDPSREPGGSPWDAAEPLRPAGSPPPWMSAGEPWASSDAAQAAAVGTAYREASPPGAAGRAGPRRWPRLCPGRGMTVTAMVTTAALLVTGGVAAWQAARMQSRLPAANTSLAISGARAGGPARSPGAGRTPARAAPAPPAGSPARGPATARGAVRVAPAAAAGPHVNRVVMVLNSYFSAINRHDFQAYSSLFIPAMRVSLHNAGAGYQSTRDSRARLTGLATTGPEGLAATVTFVSHQNPADSPDHAACDRWHITLFLRHNGGGYHIRRHQPGFPADHVRACR